MSHSTAPPPPPHRRGRGRQQPSSSGSTVRTVATAAVVAYGAYKAYEYFVHPSWMEEPNHNNNEDENVDENNNNNNNNNNGNNNDPSRGSRMSGLSQLMMSSWWFSSADEERAGGGPPRRRQQHSSLSSSPSQSPLDARTLHRLTQQSLRKCREELLKAYGTCWPSLQAVIEQHTDTSRRTHELKLLRNKDKKKEPSSHTNLPPQQQPQPQQQDDESSSSTNRLRRRQEELWKEIHVETLTRLVSTEYAATLLLLSLTMQLHWIGGQVFQRNHSLNHHHQHSAVPADADPARWAQHVMMESHHYMTHQGIPLLISAVRRAVLSSFFSSSSGQDEWTATTFVSKTQLEMLLQNIDERLERGSGSSTTTRCSGGAGGLSSTSSSYTRNWIRFVLPDPTMLVMEEDDEEDDDDHDDHDNAHGTMSPPSDKVTMVEALWDLAESPAWEDAQGQTLQLVQQVVRDQGWGQIFTSSSSSSSSAGNDATKTTTTTTMIPVAKLMAPIKAACSLVALRPVASSSNHGLPLNNTVATPMTTTKKSKNTLPQKVQKLATVLELGEVSFHAEVY